MTTCALFTALLCILGPISLPIGPVPISLTILVLFLAIWVLGMRGTLISCALYLLLGAVGLPVFSGYAGGLGKLAGPTGGYLIGFLFMVLIAGFVYDKSGGNLLWTIPAMIVGCAVDYLFGTAWFVHQMNTTWAYAISVCVTPFIPVDLAKIVIAAILGKAVRGPLLKAGLLPGKNEK